MTGANEPLSSRIAVLRLDGARFDAEGIPVNALPEVVAFEELLRDIAKQLWKRRHPHRKRVPAGYDETIGLRLVELRPGSSQSVLERPRHRADDLLSEQEILSDLDAARIEIERFIEAAAGTGISVPALVANVEGSKLKRFGQTLRASDVLQVGPDGADWERRSSYTSESRQHVLIELTGSYTGPANIEGLIDSINPGQLTAVIRTDAGSYVTASWAETGVRFEFDDRPDTEIRCRIEGIGEYNRDGLTRFTEVYSFQLLEDGDDDEPVEVTPKGRVDDELSARSALLRLGSLQRGWIDGENGEPVSEAAWDGAFQIFDLLSAGGLLTSLIFATSDGGIQFEWRDPAYSVSLEVEPSGSFYLHRADLDEGTYTEVHVDPSSQPKAL